MRQRERAQAHARQLEGAYEAYKSREIERVRSAISPEELADLETSIREELIAEGTFPNMINLGVRVKLNARLEERAGVLPYEEWRSQQGT